MYINIYTSLGKVLFNGLFIKIFISLFTLLKHKYQTILNICHLTTLYFVHCIYNIEI